MTMMNYINLTPHAIRIALTGGVVDFLDLPPTGEVARVDSVSTEGPALEVGGDGEFGFIAVSDDSMGIVQGLPAPAADTVYIVSGMVLQALKDQGVYRPDVYAPGALIRGADGQPTGAKGLRRLK